VPDGCLINIFHLFGDKLYSLFHFDDFLIRSTIPFCYLILVSETILIVILYAVSLAKILRKLNFNFVDQLLLIILLLRAYRQVQLLIEPSCRKHEAEIVYQL
jgi:hypothetical protein